MLNADPRVRMSLVRARRNPITGAVVVADVVLIESPRSNGAAAWQNDHARICSDACRRALRAAQGTGDAAHRAGARNDRRRQAGAPRCVTSSSPAPAAASGSSIARVLAAAGYRVIAVARRRRATNWRRRRARPAPPGRRHRISRRSTSRSSTASPRFVRELRTEFGPIYGLVNNAGIGTAGVLGIMRDQRHRAAGAAQYALADSADEVRARAR